MMRWSPAGSWSLQFNFFGGEISRTGSKFWWHSESGNRDATIWRIIGGAKHDKWCQVLLHFRVPSHAPVPRWSPSELFMLQLCLFRKCAGARCCIGIVLAMFYFCARRHLGIVPTDAFQVERRTTAVQLRVTRRAVLVEHGLRPRDGTGDTSRPSTT